jgi:hypothetical protein
VNLKDQRTSRIGINSSGGAEDLLRTMMIESVGPALDRALFSTAAAAPERPAGLLNGIPPLVSTGNLTNDLIMLLSQIAPVSGNSQIALVAAPDKAIAINCCRGN